MCWNEECPGGAHRVALHEAGIHTRAAWLAIEPQQVERELHNEGMDGL